MNRETFTGCDLMAGVGVKELSFESSLLIIDRGIDSVYNDSSHCLLCVCVCVNWAWFLHCMVCSWMVISVCVYKCVWLLLHPEFRCAGVENYWIFSCVLLLSMAKVIQTKTLRNSLIALMWTPGSSCIKNSDIINHNAVDIDRENVFN